jgi:hypothetical protein
VKTAGFVCKYNVGAKKGSCRNVVYLTPARACSKLARVSIEGDFLMRSFAFAFILLSSTSAMAADAPAPLAASVMKISLVRGTVESIDATTLKIKTDAGAQMAAMITPKTRFATVEARKFDQIKATDFVGITAVPGHDGHLSAEEIHILPGVMGEGQYPWDHHPASTGPVTAGSMTNGSVAATSAATRADSMTNGSVTKTSTGAPQLTVTYHGAEMVNGKCEGRAMPGKPGCTGGAIVDVPPTAPIVAIVAGTPADAKVGLAVFAAIATDDAGHMFLGSATFEKNGVKPPM